MINILTFLVSETIFKRYYRRLFSPQLCFAPLLLFCRNSCYLFLSIFFFFFIEENVKGVFVI